MLTALIMAGGQGTRFWPMSTKDKPKQFLNLVDKRTMLQATVIRLKGLIDTKHIFICTGEKYVELVKEQLPEIPNENIIIEPMARNTAPCILLGLLYIKEKYGDTNIIVLPSDHKINDEQEFRSVLADANTFLNENINSIITIGITPNRPETGYGYIKCNKVVTNINKHSIKCVERFVEKPNIEKANKYLRDRHYLWNAGMFMFNTKHMIKEFQINFNECYKLLSTLPFSNSAEYMSALKDKYALCEAISIDYAIMEKSKTICVVPVDFGWDDIGSWNALERYISKDNNNNVLKGDVYIDNAKDCIVYGTDKKIILLDIEDVFVIDVKNTLVIGKKSSISKVTDLRGKY